MENTIIRYTIQKHIPNDTYVVYQEVYDTYYHCVMAFRGVFKGTKKECREWVHRKEASNNEIERN